MVLHVVHDCCVVGVGSCGVEGFVCVDEFRYVPERLAIDIQRISVRAHHNRTV